MNPRRPRADDGGTEELSGYWVPARIIARRERNERIDAIDSADPTLRTDPAEAIEPTESAEPTEPNDSTEPIEPTDSTESRDATDSTEFSDHNDNLDPRSLMRPILGDVRRDRLSWSRSGSYTRPSSRPAQRCRSA